MSRTAKEASTRRSEILGTAQRLIYTLGYEQMTIQNILDELKISKGAFYHYFDSKLALLEALIERMIAETEQLVIPIVNDPSLSAIEKFGRFFATSAGWKLEHKTFFLDLVRIWYRDENLVVRHKIRIAGIKHYSPMLQIIIQQGIQEGVLNTRYPARAAELLLSMGDDLGDSVAAIFLASVPEAEKLTRLTEILNVYSDAIERVIGAPTGSIQLLAPGQLQQWISP